MYCTNCGVGVGDGDRFCSHCGTTTGFGPPPPPPPVSRPLLLDKRNKKVAGVCAGFARYLEVDVILVRLIWLAFALATGVGFLAYLAAWIIMPSDYGMPPYPAQPFYRQAA